MLKKIKNSLKFIKLYDFLSVFIFLFMFPLSIIYKLYNKIKKHEIWLICEDGQNARDNGYHLFKYIRDNYPEEKCYYVVNKKSNAYDKVKQYGNIIQFRGFKHWLYYLSAKWNIGIQKNGNPDQVLFYILHVYLNLYNNRVFLQHGITKDLSEWIFYKNTKFRYFICGASKEYEYIRDNFGYPEDNVKYIGFARFDNLYSNNIKEKQVLVIPTWRTWFKETNKLGDKFNIKETKYYKEWMKLLNSEQFIDFIEKNNINVLFYPHINMMRFIDDFQFKSNRITKLSLNDDLQSVMKESALMITDYSSVYMDFAYMEKPVIYYQFDIEEYRAGQLQEGYFNYERDGFGPVCKKFDNVVDNLKDIYSNNKFILKEEFYNKMHSFFELKDKNNCERHYQLLKNGKVNL